MEYRELNNEQREAVYSDHPRILCLAGAGSGKTHTLVTRAARLLEDGVDPEEILMLTFTNAAAREQKERLVWLAGEAGEKVHASTFHSWAVREIRKYANKVRLESNFSIYDQEDTESLVTAIIDDLQYEIKPKEVIEAMTKKHVYGVPIPIGDMRRVVEEYNFRCRYQNAIDIDSLIDALQRLLDDPTINKIMRNQYKYVFVDEMQDTDHRQMRLINTLDPENLFVVGDDFQSIYGFRGADVNIIIDLSKNPDWQTIKLEENYRSTHQIVEPANRLISHNNQTDKILRAHREGTEIEFIEHDNPEEELDWIAGKCIVINFDDFYRSTAVLARTNKQIDAIAERLSERDVPYVIRKKTADALMTMEAKKLSAWMQAVINPRDDEALAAIINWPVETITKREMLKIEMYKLENDCSLFSALEALGQAQEITKTIRDFEEDDLGEVYAVDLHDAIIDKTVIVWKFRELSLENRNERIRKLRDEILKWSMARYENGETITATDWLEYYKMRIVEGAEIVEDTDKDAIQLMTVHGSKGLEFDNVIVAGLNMKSFPLSRGDIEEERRLFYVAMTRAKNHLYLSRSVMRNEWGGRLKEAEPSIFLEEL